MATETPTTIYANIMVLSVFDANGQISSKQLEVGPPLIPKAAAMFRGMDYSPDHQMFSYWQLNHRKEKTVTFLVQPNNANGTKNGDPIRLLSFPLGKMINPGYVYSAWSPDHQRFAVIGWRTDVDEATMVIGIYDQNYQKLHEKEISFGIEYKDFRGLTQITVNNNGHVFFSGMRSEEGYKMGVSGFLYNPDNEKLQEVFLNPDNQYLKSYEVTVNAMGAFQITGLYRHGVIDDDDGPIGVVYMLIDPVMGGDPLLYKATPFNEAHYRTYFEGVKNSVGVSNYETGDIPDYLKIVEVHQRPGGGVYLIAEVQYKDNAVANTYDVAHYYHMDVMVLMIDKNGNVEKQVKIDKYNYTNRHQEMEFHSVGSFLLEDDLYLFYNKSWGEVYRQLPMGITEEEIKSSHNLVPAYTMIQGATGATKSSLILSLYYDPRGMSLGNYRIKDSEEILDLRPKTISVTPEGTILFLAQGATQYVWGNLVFE